MPNLEPPFTTNSPPGSSSTPASPSAPRSPWTLPRQAPGRSTRRGFAAPPRSQLEPMHVALGEIAAARVQRQPSLGREQVLHLEEVVRFLSGEEPMFHQAHEHAASEVLVAL